MKTLNKESKQVKYQSLARPDEFFYSINTWSTREIDGVVFLSVNKQPIEPGKKQPIAFIRKDSVKRI